MVFLYPLCFFQDYINREQKREVHLYFGEKQADYLQQKIETYTGIKMNEEKITPVTAKNTETTPVIEDEIAIEDTEEYIEIEEPVS